MEANADDVRVARSEGAASAVIDRLVLDEKRVRQMTEGVRQVPSLPDPVGELLAEWSRHSGIFIKKVRVPIGVIGMVFEGRPNVTLDSAALCLKSGNCVLVRGSRVAIHSNRVIVSLVREALVQSGFEPDCVQLFDSTERSELQLMLNQRGKLDLVIPRGGKDLIDHVCETSRVPVLETGAGVCHVYVHADADPSMADRIVVNAKCQRPSVCNAMETLLVHESWAVRNLAGLIHSLRSRGVECRGDARARAIVPDIANADEADWSAEYLDLILAVKVVSSLEEAVNHIDRYGTRHSESIVTADAETAAEFQQSVDAAAVYHNCSTGLTDGFEFGFGAEIGISTQKLHARGPLGLAELTTYKYVVRGDGVVRGA
jgi:glutamate-5-semialdehyde dehydrogenase